MNPMSSGLLVANKPQVSVIQQSIGREIEQLMASLPVPENLSVAQRRDIIARYTAVLEGNFIYWMTGAYIAAKSEEARGKIMENLHEEVRDAHPLMLRKFAVAANAVPTDADSLAVNGHLTDMRLFVGRLSPVRIVASMAFFEGFIQQFMSYLATLARLQGSQEMVYTDVHGVCDVTHTEELYRALQSEIDLADEIPSEKDLYEGVGLLKTLLHKVIFN